MPSTPNHTTLLRSVRGWFAALAASVILLATGFALVGTATIAGASPDVPGRVPTPTMVPANNALTVNWTAPVDSGPPITSYTVLLYGVPYTFGPTTFTHTFTSAANNGSIQNGQWYHPVVRASNSVGDGLYSFQPANAYPGIVPTEPTNVVASVSGSSIKVNWDFSSASSGNGGWPISYYKVTESPGGETYSTTNGNTHQITWSGLPPGSHTFTVKAYCLGSGAGYPFQPGPGACVSPESQPSNAVGTPIPPAAPATPAPPVLSAGNNTLTVTWKAPTNNGSPITSYTVLLWGVPYTYTVGDYTSNFTSPSPNTYTVNYTSSYGGITNGDWYHPVVSATNIFGTSSYSFQPAQVYPGTAPTAPGTPVATIAGPTSVSLTWPFSTASSGNGGWQIAYYQVNFSNGTVVDTSSGYVHQLLLTGLDLEGGLSFTVQAYSVNGTPSPVSATSNMVGGG